MGRIIGIIVGLAALVNGVKVITDGDCNSVSFGGQGRVLMINCFPDGSGLIPGFLAGFLVILLGIFVIAVAVGSRR